MDKAANEYCVFIDIFLKMATWRNDAAEGVGRKVEKLYDSITGVINNTDAYDDQEVRLRIDIICEHFKYDLLMYYNHAKDSAAFAQDNDNGKQTSRSGKSRRR
jgi:hypothetical protein